VVTSGDLLRGWPKPSAPDVRAPRYLPDEDTLGSYAKAERSEDSRNRTYDGYVQLWATKDASTKSVTIVTRPGDKAELPDGAKALEVGTWDVAYVDPKTNVLVLSSASGRVEITAPGVSDTATLAIAKSLSRRTSGAGWDADIGRSYTLLFDGWQSRAGSRLLLLSDKKGLVAQVEILSGLDPSPPVDVDRSEATTVGDHDALVYSNKDLAGVIWSPDSGVQISVIVKDDAKAALALARSLGPVDRDAWLAATKLFSSSGGGCSFLVC
jgi:hypothetical protein